MPESLALATVCHDPKGRLLEQTARLLPTLSTLFAGIALQASPTTAPDLLGAFAAQNALVRLDEEPLGAAMLGKKRRHAVTTGLELGTSHLLYIDCDRLLHWLEAYPDELRATLPRLMDADLSVLGRTPRAFATHPRSMRDTESVANHLFALVSGYDWDVLAAARGLSRRAATLVSTRAEDDAISNDVSWLLLLLEHSLSTQYFACEGFEYETADRFQAEIAAAGGLAAWTEARDRDPKRWLTRLHYAQLMAKAMEPYTESRSQSK